MTLFVSAFLDNPAISTNAQTNDHAMRFGRILLLNLPLREGNPADLAALITPWR